MSEPVATSFVGVLEQIFVKGFFSVRDFRTAHFRFAASLAIVHPERKIERVPLAASFRQGHFDQSKKETSFLHLQPCSRAASFV